MTIGRPYDCQPFRNIYVHNLTRISLMVSDEFPPIYQENLAIKSTSLRFRKFYMNQGEGLSGTYCVQRTAERRRPNG